MTAAAWAGRREGGRQRGFKRVRRCEIECCRGFVQLRWRLRGRRQAAAGGGVIARGWTGCLSNTLFPFNPDKETTRGTKMTIRGERRPRCDMLGPEVDFSHDELTPLDVILKAFYPKILAAFVEFIVRSPNNYQRFPSWDLCQWPRVLKC